MKLTRRVSELTPSATLQAKADAESVRDREQAGSRNWAGYGVGLLRVGGPGHRMEVGLAYTRASLHNEIGLYLERQGPDAHPHQQVGRHGRDLRPGTGELEKPQHEIRARRPAGPAPTRPP